MVRFYFVILVVLHCYLPICSQGSGGGAATSSSGVASMTNPSIPYDLYATNLKKGREYQDVELAYGNYEGSPFINDIDTYGQLELNNGNIIANVPIQYDAYRGEVIVAQKDGRKIALNNRYYRKLILKIDGDEVIFVKAHPGEPNRFYQILWDHPEISLLKDVSVELIESKRGDITSTEPFFRKIKTYFIKINDSVGPLKLKKKELFKYFNDSTTTEMKAILKRNKFKLKKEEDFIRLLSLYLGK